LSLKSGRLSANRVIVVVAIGTRRHVIMKQSRPAIYAVIALLAALFVTVSGCSWGGGAEEYHDPNIPIVVEVGQEFIIVLESNPTTGYQWQLVQPLEEEVLSLVKTEFEEQEEEGLFGAAGEERWTFKAESRGDTIIDFAYVRPWEEEPEGTLEEAAIGLAEEEAPEPTVDDDEDVEDEEDETTEPEEEGEVVEIAAPEEEEDTFHRTFVVEVKKEGSKGEEAKEYSDPDAEIEVEQDFKFAIQLESSPSAGFRWQLAQPLDESILELVKTEYKSEEKKSSEETEGEGEEPREGTETWTFEAVGEGDTEIHFEYVNTTEEAAAPEEEKVFKVKVHIEKEEHITEE
jgi:predicted secreted protein